MIKLTPANAPEYISWRFIHDGNGFGFYDTRIVEEWNQENDGPALWDKSWLEPDENGDYWLNDES